jgi:hypothetical protein
LRHANPLSFFQVLLLMRHGPGVRKLEAGETVELAFDPPAKKDVKGKGKAVEDSDDDAVMLTSDVEDDSGAEESEPSEEEE